jgi:hypothetical protein
MRRLQIIHGNQWGHHEETFACRVDNGSGACHVINS